MVCTADHLRQLYVKQTENSIPYGLWLEQKLVSVLNRSAGPEPMDAVIFEPQREENACER